MMLQMMKDVHPPRPWDPNSHGSQDLLWKGLNQDSGGERSKTRGGDDRPSLDRKLKGPEQMGVGIPWEVVQTQAPLEEWQPAEAAP